MSFAALWKQVGDVGAEIDPENGTYEVVVAEADAFESRNGNEIGKLLLEITAGAQKGKRFAHMMTFTSEVGARIAKESLGLYGLDTSRELGDLDELADEMKGLIGVAASVTVAHSEAGYTNVKVHRAWNPGQTEIPVDVADLPPAQPQRPGGFAAASTRPQDRPDEPAPWDQ